jgi:hypothetical protein
VEMAWCVRAVHRGEGYAVVGGTHGKGGAGACTGGTQPRTVACEGEAGVAWCAALVVGRR